MESGITGGDEMLAAAHDYLDPMVAAGVDTLILGCTHYPLLTGVISYVLGDRVTLVSSAEETAKDVYATLLAERLLRRDDAGSARHEFLATGDPAAFERVASVFLGPELTDVGAAQAEPVGGGSWS